jgi:hypothetical protein
MVGAKKEVARQKEGKLATPDPKAGFDGEGRIVG